MGPWVEHITMSIPLISTKLFAPRRNPNHVTRARLLACLDDGAARSLTLISAPAGFGKTTLVSEWLEARTESEGWKTAWLSLDSDDNDLARFTGYLLAALSRLHPGVFDATRGILQPTEPEAHKALLASFLNDLADSKGQTVIVLDDYHVITEPVIHDALLYLLEHLPVQVRLMITTRADPPWPLARLRARAQLVEVRAADLRFTLDESRQFLNSWMGLNLPVADVAALEARTEGWAAGLQLAALSMRGQERTDKFIAAFTGTHRYIVDYLSEEALQQQPEAVQQFLLQTSILERMCGPLCDAVTDNATGRTMLQRLERANLFVVSLDTPGQWYRYHHLFADFLRGQLRKIHPECWADLHRRAAEWCERNGFSEDAVRYALSAPDYDLATRLIRHVADRLWGRSEIVTMLNWLKVMPEDLFQTQPRLCIQQAWAFAISGQLDLVEPILERLERTESNAADRLEDASAESYSPEQLAMHCAVLRAFVGRFRLPLPEAMQLGERAVELTPLEMARARGMACVFLGHLCLLNGELDRASNILIESSALCRAHGHAAAYLSAMHYLAQVRRQQGRLRDAMALYAEADKAVQAMGEQTLSGIAQIGLGELLVEQNDLENAEALIEIGAKLAEAGGDFVFRRDGHLARAKLAQARGHWENARAALNQAEHVARRSASARDIALIGARHARLRLAQGDNEAARNWAQLSELSLDGSRSPQREMEHLTLARVRLAQGAPDATVCRMLERIQQTAEEQGRNGRLIETLCLLALTYRARGQHAQAQSALQRALRLAEPEGYMRVFVDEGEPMRLLITEFRLLLEKQARAAYPNPARAVLYAERLLEAFPKVAANDRQSKIPSQTSILVDPLSERELEVLRLIAKGQSPREIAHELVIAIGTVRNHLKNIYAKLHAHNRVQALERARSMSLLGVY